MPIDIQQNDGSALAMIPIDLELPVNLSLKETIMGRSLTPPPDGGPELGPYCTNDGIISAAGSGPGHLKMYAEHKLQKILPNALAPTIATLQADEQAQCTLRDDIIKAEAALQQKIQDPVIKAKIKDAVKQATTPVEKDWKLALDRLESVTKITTDFPALTLDTHTKCFQMTYTHPDHGAANVVMRFGIIAQNCSIIAQNPNILQPTEYVLFQLAKDYLAMPNNHVALLDIVARENGAIKQDTTNSKFPETHTILLWKKTDSTIFVIDPNQKTFSDFVVQTLQALGEDINNEPALSTTFYKNNYLLENGEPKIGSGAGYMRDCIDIAIKVGFELNRLVGPGNSDEEILKRLYAKLSNEAIGNNLSKALNSVRDAHSTDQNKVANAESIQTFLNDAKYKLVKK